MEKRIRRNLSSARAWRRLFVVFAIAALGGGALGHAMEAPSRVTGSVMLTSRIGFTMEEIVIIGRRTEEPAFESPRAVSVVSQAAGRLGFNDRTVPDLMREMTGVFLQKTTHGHGAPIIRGLIGRDILSMVDGIRLNTSTYRSGPVQYLNTIDAESVGRVELVRGAGSVLYGSDALGGAVNVRTSTVYPSGPLSVRVGLKGQSADRGVMSHLEAAGTTGDVGYRVGGSVKSFGDLRAGGGFGVQAPTAYRETDGNASLRWRIDEAQALQWIYQGVDQVDVPRYHHYQEAKRVYGVPAFQEFTYDQRRHLGIVKYEGRGVAGLEGVEGAVSWQRQLEGNRQRRIASDAVTELEDTVDTVGGYLQGTKAFDDHVVTAGAEGYRDTVRSLAWSLSAASGIKSARASDSTFPDGSTYSTIGMFGQDQWQIGACQVTPGVRWTRFAYQTTLRNAPLSGPLEDGFQDVTAHLSASIPVAEGWRVVGTVGQGFRAPNLDDMVTLRTTSTGVDVPVAGLRAEKSVMAEVGLKMLRQDVEGAFFLYGMDIVDRIARKAGTYQGLTYVDTNGNGVKDATEPSVFQKQNIGRAQIFGVEGEAQWRPAEPVTVFGAVGWTYGQNLSEGEPLSKIPPLNGRLGLRYGAEGWWVEGFTQFAGSQDRLSSSDRSDPRMDPAGTPAWATINLRGGWRIAEGWQVSGGVANLLDAGYREHGSGVDAPGLNVTVGTTVRF